MAVAALVLDRASELELSEDPALAEAYVEERWEQFLDAVIWIAWCVAAALIGTWAVRLASAAGRRSLILRSDPDRSSSSSSPAAPSRCGLDPYKVAANEVG